MRRHLVTGLVGAAVSALMVVAVLLSVVAPVISEESSRIPFEADLATSDISGTEPDVGGSVSSFDNSPEPATDESETPASADPGTVLLAGDSLMAQTLTEITRPGNRQPEAPVFVMAAEGGSGLFEMEYWLDRLSLLVAVAEPDAVVISWGYNSAQHPEVVSDYAARAGAVLDVLGEVPVLWYTPRHGYFSSTEIARQVADAAADRSNVEVRSLHVLLDGHPERIAEDGVHLTWWGQIAFAHDILGWCAQHGLGAGDHSLE